MTPAKSENKPADNKSQDEQPVSRSQLKRDAQAIKSLASDLLKLKTSELQHVPLDKTILLAIQEAQEIRSHGARRRQLQYIAKLLRRIDAGIIIEVVNSFQSGTRGNGVPASAVRVVSTPSMAIVDVSESVASL